MMIFGLKTKWIFHIHTERKSSALRMMEEMFCFVLFLLFRFPYDLLGIFWFLCWSYREKQNENYVMIFKLILSSEE